MNADEIKVTINEYGQKRLLACKRGRRLADLLKSMDIIAISPCGGMGRCGKCACRIVRGRVLVTSADERFFSAKELSEGMRLLCRVVLQDDCEIELLSDAKDSWAFSAAGEGERPGEKMTILSDSGSAELSKKDCSGREYSKAAIAVDLGSTTVAAALVGMGKDGFCDVLGTASCVNHQSAFGADVISRIAASEDEKALRGMRDAVRSDIKKLIDELCEGSRGPLPISHIIVAGNTAMLTILAGESPAGLGSYPYTPPFLDERTYDSGRDFSWPGEANVILIPGISAFVGADILAGLYSLDITGESSALLADLGTNGEMAFWDGENLRVTSTAAGPVFEACGISCGMPSVEGAISHVTIDVDTKEVSFETIGGGSPRGLCGTGVMEAVSELVRTGICDPSGLLCDKYFDGGFPITWDGGIRLTQSDIRNLQLAKAAISSGLKMLLGDKTPDKVFLSGAFGTHLNPEEIKNLSLFPGAFNDKIISSGNTSLKGAVKYAAACLEGDVARSEAAEQMRTIKSNATVIELPAADNFDKEYIAAMNFLE